MGAKDASYSDYADSVTVGGVRLNQMFQGRDKTAPPKKEPPPDDETLEDSSKGTSNGDRRSSTTVEADPTEPTQTQQARTDATDRSRSASAQDRVGKETLGPEEDERGSKLSQKASWTEGPGLPENDRSKPGPEGPEGPEGPKEDLNANQSSFDPSVQNDWEGVDTSGLSENNSPKGQVQSGNQANDRAPAEETETVSGRGGYYTDGNSWGTTIDMGQHG